jgi:hypothetical protein
MRVLKNIFPTNNMGKEKECRTDVYLIVFLAKGDGD